MATARQGSISMCQCFLFVLEFTKGKWAPTCVCTVWWIRRQIFHTSLSDHVPTRGIFIRILTERMQKVVFFCQCKKRKQWRYNILVNSREMLAPPFRKWRKSALYDIIKSTDTAPTPPCYRRTELWAHSSPSKQVRGPTTHLFLQEVKNFWKSLWWGKESRKVAAKPNVATQKRSSEMTNNTQSTRSTCSSWLGAAAAHQGHADRFL